MDLKYQRCVACKKLDTAECNGPNLSVLTNKEKARWMKERANYLNMTHQMIADRVNIAKGTVDSVLSGPTPNPTSETLRLILSALGLRDAGDNPCPDAELIASMEAELRELKAHAADSSRERTEMSAESQKKIDHLKEEINHLRGELVDYKNLLHRREQTVKSLSVALSILVVLVIGLLIFDLLVPTVGYFRF